MTVKKKRDSGPEINVPTILDFAESFIDSCDPELDVAELTEIFAGSLLITQSTSKLQLSLRQHFGKSNDMVE